MYRRRLYIKDDRIFVMGDWEQVRKDGRLRWLHEDQAREFERIAIDAGVPLDSYVMEGVVKNPNYFRGLAQSREELNLNDYALNEDRIRQLKPRLDTLKCIHGTPLGQECFLCNR